VQYSSRGGKPHHTRGMTSFSGSAQVNEIMRQVKEKLQARSGSVMQMFHSMDHDQSQQLSRDEFAACLKEFGIGASTLCVFVDLTPR
jgi:hypothetical protein